MWSRTMSAKAVTIGVVGVGAIGGWIAGSLAAAGNPVAVLARGETLARLTGEGLKLKDNSGERTLEVEASADARAIGPCDLLVVAVKAPALADAAAAVGPMIGPDTLIVPMINGVPWWFLGNRRIDAVDPDGAIAAELPTAQLIGCVVHASCRRTAPNRVHVVHSDRLLLGEPAGGTSDRVDRLCALFQEAGIRTEESPDIRRSMWYKLWGNATINPLSALTRATTDRLTGDPAMRAWLLAAMEELAAVGAAVGCPISESGEDRMQVTARLGAFKTSMLQDVEAGRPIELEALLGAPIEIAKRQGIAVPHLERLYAMTRLLAASLESA